VEALILFDAIFERKSKLFYKRVSAMRQQRGICCPVWISTSRKGWRLWLRGRWL